MNVTYGDKEIFVTKMTLDEMERVRGFLNSLRINGEKFENILPRPVVCDGKGKLTKNYSLSDWYLKLQEEVSEVYRAYILQSVNRGKVSDIDVALADVVTVCISWFENIGVDEKARSEIFARVNEKNEKRGYFGNA